MIVMNFGGASLSSPASIRQVAALVRSRQHRQPVVFISALGDTAFWRSFRFRPSPPAIEFRTGQEFPLP
jgi:hypothetical protein